MSQGTEWYRQQSEYNKRVYEWLHESRPDLTDWKVTTLFYSALHRANHWFAVQTGTVPSNHAERNLRVKYEMPPAFNDYRDLYTLSMRARYRDGFRTHDSHRRHALVLLGRLEEGLTFPQGPPPGAA